MAAAPQKESTEALIQRLEASRQGLGTHVAGLRRALDVPSRVKGSFKQHPVLWFGSSLGVGFVASKLLRRPKTIKAKQKGKKHWLGFVISTLFTILKPALIKLATQELQRRVANPSTEERLPLSKT